MKNMIVFKELDANGLDYLALLGWLLVFIVAGLGSSWYMEHNGHIVTGMTNQIVWGMPHVFAVFMIIAASGALNIASISSVFQRKMYKPLARISAILAIALLAGGLMVLVLDLGRPDRLIVAMTKYNFKSIFAWNIYLYSGFFVVVLVYLWMMMERRMNRYARAAGIFAFVWRLALTTGTGSIFGFLVARQAYDPAIMAPMFITMSFSFGLAIFILLLLFTYKATNRPLGDRILFMLKNLLGVFAAAVLYFIVVRHLSNLYATHRHGVEAFILLNGGVYTALFWIGAVLMGCVLPIALLFHPATGKSCSAIMLSCWLVILGGLAQIYVIIIGGQAYPLDIFPGYQVSSSFFDGVVHPYAPSLPEILLGLSGMATAVFIVAIAMRYLPILPMSLSDAAVDPSHDKSK
ncbi:NrfD/PsrC family molybdoenzyme membrane anchor subunit [Varunaivibrio sulfuroxidans]|uniref:Molybdopterin-containing oxidoreductase family membrane subunit n=1 Tax=Varunaivibrio sulfuroxidans TaxID=1773489 RepID=A0A4R3J3D1_9PROT|nr:NrfD/PsrC family molybdoenzyme membrane anchor subunit [Varunaivibrio sulfuroxidans]TCS60328.1 molybdopterin-containing oxidoreductase family membrane subunit [Varunaivibrio sulfuroxidans]WES30985.1 polysulfide reductase NrfD [Varunaivibrio sulfuroxidans]